MGFATIHDITTAASYTVRCADGCRDSVDRSVVEPNDAVSMGCGVVIELFAGSDEPTRPEAA